MWTFFSASARKRHGKRSPSRGFRPRLEALEDRCCPSVIGPGGVEWSDPLGSISQVMGVAIQPADGKMVSLGRVSVMTSSKNFDELGVMRMNPDGSLDTTFNKTGSVNLLVGYDTEAQPALALQPDGKILVGGQAYPTKQTDQSFTDAEYVVARLNSNGTLDTTFANQGIYTWTPSATSNSWLGSLAVLGDGSIAVVGTSNGFSGALLFKLSASGTRVSSFGSGGTAILNSISSIQAPQVIVAPNGDLIVSGSNSGGQTGFGLLYAVNPSSGALDPGFNNGQGCVTVTNPAGTYTQISDVAIQGNRIVASGYVSGTGSAYPDALLTRYGLSGTLDTTFAAGGSVTMVMTDGLTNLFVAPELDSSLVVLTRGSSVMGSSAMEVGHFTADGQLDATFGGAGTGFKVIPSVKSYGGPAIAADGSIVVVGSTGSPPQAFLARLTPPEAMIGSFIAGPNPVSAGGIETLTASNIAGDGYTITQVAFYVSINGVNTLLGYGTQTSPGVWTLTFTVNLAPGSYTLFAQAEDSNGVFGDLFALTLTVQ
jgi:uncharacterized delta-60 repeat protein